MPRRPGGRARRSLANASALLRSLAPCSDWHSSMETEWYMLMERLRLTPNRVRLEAARQPGRVQRHYSGGVGYYEAYLWRQCVPDAHYDVGHTNFHKGADHWNHIWADYDPACWAAGAPSGACPGDAGPARACEGCRMPVDPALSRRYSVSHWQEHWDVDVDMIEALAGGEPFLRGRRVPISGRAARHLRSYLHSTHNRGPFHWVPFLEVFDWLFLQFNPKSQHMIQRMLKRTAFARFPGEGRRLPATGGFLVRQVDPPRSVFITIPLLPYFMRFILPEAPASGVAVYLGRGWEDAWTPDRWLRALAEHPKVLHVFAENPRIRHPRITAMAIGLDPVAVQGQPGVGLGGIAALATRLDEKIVDRAPGGWSVYGPVRQAAKEYILSRPWCDWIDTVWAGDQHQQQMEYWRRMARYAFIFSPPAVYIGEGPGGSMGDTDSYRTFEALVLRAIPILWDGPNAWAWEGLPVVTVSNWTEVTPANLRRWWQEKRHLLEGDQPYLRSAYWWAKIERVLNASGRPRGRPAGGG